MSIKVPHQLRIVLERAQYEPYSELGLGWLCELGDLRLCDDFVLPRKYLLQKY
jgi:hypothetical protein